MKITNIQAVKILGLPIGGGSGDDIPRDGDGDGMFTPPGSTEDNMPLGPAMNFARKKIVDNPDSFVNGDRRSFDDVLKSLKTPGSGFTRDRTARNAVKTGISIARNKHGYKIPANEMFDQNGQVTDKAAAAFVGFLKFHGEGVFGNPHEGAREVGIGGWHDEESGIIYLDVVDIYDNEHGIKLPDEFKNKMVEIGKKENQISIANLDAIEADDWDNALHSSGGDGSEVIDINKFIEFYRAFRNHPSNRRSKSLLTGGLLNGILLIPTKEVQ